MNSPGIKMGPAPPHAGAFIRIEALEEFGLSVSVAARILGVRRAALPGGMIGEAADHWPAPITVLPPRLARL